MKMTDRFPAKKKSQYTWTNFSTEQLSHLKKYFNELLFDQLPVLKDLARVVDEVILGASYKTEEVMRSALILEQIPETFDHLTSRTKENYARIAQKQAAEYFDPTDGEAIKSTRSQLESMLKSFEFLANLEDETKSKEREARGRAMAQPRGKGRTGPASRFFRESRRAGTTGSRSST